jgi:hypothetical protein
VRKINLETLSSKIGCKCGSKKAGEKVDEKARCNVCIKQFVQAFLYLKHKLYLLYSARQAGQTSMHVSS